MADNYLERRMEEHRASQNTPPRSTYKPAPLKPGRVIINYPPSRILVTDGDTPTGQAVIRGFIAMKCPVSFTVADSATGASIAQATGARYIPGSPEDAIEWHSSHADPIKANIDIGTTRVDIIEDTVISIHFHPQPIKNGPEAITSWCIFALHPANRWLAIH